MNKNQTQPLPSLLSSIGQAIFVPIMILGPTALLYAYAAGKETVNPLLFLALALTASMLLLFALTKILSRVHNGIALKLLLLLFTLICSVSTFVFAFGDSSWFLLCLYGFLTTSFGVASLLKHKMTSVYPTNQKQTLLNLSYAGLFGIILLFISVILLLFGNKINLDTQTQHLLLFSTHALLFLVLTLSLLFLPMPAEKTLKKIDNHPKNIQATSGKTLLAVVSAGSAILLFLTPVFHKSLGLTMETLLWMMFPAVSLFILGRLHSASRLFKKRGTHLTTLSITLCLLASLCPTVAAAIQKTHYDRLFDESRTVIARYGDEHQWSDDRAEQSVVNALSSVISYSDRQDRFTGALLQGIQDKALSVEEAVALNEAMVTVFGNDELTRPYDQSMENTRLLLWAAVFLGGLGLGILSSAIFQPSAFKHSPKASPNLSLCFLWGGLGLGLFALLCFLTNNALWGYIISPVCFTAALLLSLRNKGDKQNNES